MFEAAPGMASDPSPGTVGPSVALRTVRRALSGSRENLLQAANCLRVIGLLEESVQIYREVQERYGAAADGLRSGYGLALALTGRVDEAIPLMREHVQQFSGDDYIAYCLGSCLAYRGHFEEADSYFCRNIPVQLRNGTRTTTEVIRVSRAGMHPAHVRISPELPFRRYPVIGGGGTSDLQEIDLFYFVACDSTDAKLFLPGLVQSLRIGSAGLALHVHLVDPDRECMREIGSLSQHSKLPILVSHESCTWAEGASAAQHCYNTTLSRFLVLPDLVEMYRKPILMADIRHSPVLDLTVFRDNLACYDVCLGTEPEGVINLLSLIPASPLALAATRSGLRFASAIRDYLFHRMLQLKNRLLPGLAEAALATAVLRDPNVRCRIVAGI